MNVFGIGTMELLVILLVAFVALGPGKTMEVARTIGRMTREARRTFTDIMDAASVTERDVDSARRQTDATPPSAAPQPPTDPLPMPSHLRESDAPTPEQPPKADTDSTDPQR